ncbi:hypothetical protein C1I98_28380 [Spongiactinospora gelatinilytica]|uniref:Uncharacterized protein n=1 Tax=Spongiactinospora gelatinilytica TaxID=2666298 RepID=A0A2W2F990_9ACTN|nr:hypothetical protein C1I98_28380 [Spongiactinospora gelatinilytica]
MAATRRLRSPQRFATRELAETLLTTLRMVRRAENATLTGRGTCEQDVREALVKVLHAADWPRVMAHEAIDYALAHDDLTMALAMYACQTGGPIEALKPQPRQFLITDEQAQAVADVIRRSFSGGTGHPEVLAIEDGDDGRFIAWLEGPDDWAWRVTQGAGRPAMPQGLRIEAATHASVRVLPAD